jgi:shikimate 5-dehydrogenase
MQRFGATVIATSACMNGELPPIGPAVFAAEALACELVCGKGLTPLLRLAQNAAVKRWADGVGMLVERGRRAFAWFVWRARGNTVADRQADADVAPEAAAGARRRRAKGLQPTEEP